MSVTALLVFIGVCALTTFATRLLPFVALARQADHPLILHLGRYLPPAVMLILVIYALRDFRPLIEGHLNAAANGWPPCWWSSCIYGGAMPCSPSLSAPQAIWPWFS